MINPFKVMCTRYAGVIGKATFDPKKKHKRLSHVNLLWMLTQVESSYVIWPLDKTGRWIGFVQGCLAMQGLVDVDTERAWSRPIIHDYYNKTGVIIPDTMELN